MIILDDDDLVSAAAAAGGLVYSSAIPFRTKDVTILSSRSPFLT